MARNLSSTRQVPIKKWQESTESPSDDLEVTDEGLRLLSSRSRGLTSAGTGYEPPTLEQLKGNTVPADNSTTILSENDRQPAQQGARFARPASSGPPNKSEFSYTRPDLKAKKVDYMGPRLRTKAGSQDVDTVESSGDANDKRSSPPAETQAVATDLEQHQVLQSKNDLVVIVEPDLPVHKGRGVVHPQAHTHSDHINHANTSRPATSGARSAGSTVQRHSLDVRPQTKELGAAYPAVTDSIQPHLEAASSLDRDSNSDFQSQDSHTEANRDTCLPVDSDLSPKESPDSAPDSHHVNKDPGGVQQNSATIHTSRDPAEQGRNMEEPLQKGQNGDQNAQTSSSQESDQSQRFQPIEPNTRTDRRSPQVGEPIMHQQRPQQILTSVTDPVTLAEGNTTHAAGEAGKKLSPQPMQQSNIQTPGTSSVSNLRTSHMKGSSDTIPDLSDATDTEDSSDDAEPTQASATSQSLVMLFQNLEREEAARKKRLIKSRARRQELKEKQELIELYDSKLLEEVERNKKLEVQTEQYKQTYAQANAARANSKTLETTYAALKDQHKKLSETQQASASQLGQLKEVCQKAAIDVKEAQEAAKLANQQQTAGSKALETERRAASQLKKDLEAAKSTAETELSAAVKSLEKKTQGELISLRDVINQQPKISPEMLKDIFTEIQALKNQHVDLSPALAGVKELVSTTMQTHSEKVQNGFADLKKSQEQFATIRSVEGHIRHAIEGLKVELVTCQELQDQIKKLTSDHAALQQNQQAQSSHVSSLEARRNELEVALAGAKERLTEYESKLRDAEARPIVDDGMKERLHQAEDQLKEMRTTRDRLQSEIEHAKETHDAGTEQLNGLLSENAKMRSDLQHLNERIAAQEEKEAAIRSEVDTAVRQEMHKAHKQMDQKQTNKHANALFQAQQDALRLKTQLETAKTDLDSARHAEESLRAEVSNHAEAQKQAMQLSEANSRLQEELRTKQPTAEQQRLQHEYTARLADMSKQHELKVKEAASLEMQLRNANDQLNATKAINQANEVQTRAAAENEAERKRLEARVKVLEEELRQRLDVEDGVQTVQKSTGISQQLEGYDFVDDLDLQDVELSQDGLRNVRSDKQGSTKRHPPADNDRDELGGPAPTQADPAPLKRRKVNRNASKRLGAPDTMPVDSPNDRSSRRVGKPQYDEGRTEQPRLSQAASEDMLFDEYLEPGAYADAEEDHVANSKSQSIVPETQLPQKSLFATTETLTPTRRQNLRSASYDFGSDYTDGEHAHGSQRAGSRQQNAPNSSHKRFPQHPSHDSAFTEMDGFEGRGDVQQGPARTRNSMPVQRSTKRATTQYTLPAARPSTPKMPQRIETATQSQDVFRKPSLPTARGKRSISDAMNNLEPSKKRTKSSRPATELKASQDRQANRAQSQVPVTRRRSQADREATGRSPALSKATTSGASPMKAARALTKASKSTPTPAGKLRPVHRSSSSRPINYEPYTQASAENVFSSHLQRTSQQKP